ncbi:MAG: hypothetical protein A2X36_04230 [Elusimicrobia bacterium GWA2_69_24]|nr:MAG: hypothetical protein A2X36_04230 [Elusimicrobia bacterium GWA2_69_24]HBL16145.1 RNA-binding protein [Elusimicrobiota bacterium]
MTNKLFVGGLPYETTQDELTKLFSGCGKVNSVKIIMDRETGRSKGFGFVEMATEAEAQAALMKLNGTSLGPRQIFINEARPQERRPPGSFPVRPGMGAPRPGMDRPGGFGPDKKFGEKPGWSPEKKGDSWNGKSNNKKWGGKKRSGKHSDFDGGMRDGRGGGKRHGSKRDQSFEG